MNSNLEVHREQTIQELKTLLETHNRVACVRPTGYGKTYIISRLCEDFTGDKLILEPQTSLIYYMQEHFDTNQTTQIETYQSLMFKTTNQEIVEKHGYNISYIFLDEAHRVGAEKWSKGVQLLLDTYPQAKVVAMTATPVRSDGKDIVDKVFNNVQVEPLTLADAIVKGLLPAPTYVSSLYTLEEEVRNYISKVERSTRITEDKKAKILDKLNQKQLELERTHNIPFILNKYLRNHELLNKNMKFIVFCSDIKELESSRLQVKAWFEQAFPNHKINTFKLHSNLKDKLEGISYREEVECRIAGFQEPRSANTIDLMFAVNMFNEGLHLEGVIGTILLRKTISEVIYFQQLGRAIKPTTKYRPIIFDFVNNSKSVKRAYPTIIKEAIRKDKDNVSVYNEESSKDANRHSINTSSSNSKTEETIQLNIFDEISDVVTEFKRITSSAGKQVFWESWEEDIVRKYYPIGGTKEVLKQGVNKTPVQISSRAIKLNALYDDKNKWSTEEVEIMKKYYPTGGTKAVIENGVNRTPKQISAKAELEGLKVLREDWNTEELRILHNEYPLGGSIAVQKAGVSRGIESIQRKARIEGLKVIKSTKEWTEEEIQAIKLYYVDGGSKAVQKAGVDRTSTEIGSKASKLGLKRDSLPLWSEEELALLRLHYSKSGYKAVQKAGVDKTATQIRSRARIEGLPKSSLWSEEEIELIKLHFPTGGYRAVQEAGVTKTGTQIQTKAAKLGLSRKRV